VSLVPRLCCFMHFSRGAVREMTRGASASAAKAVLSRKSNDEKILDCDSPCTLCAGVSGSRKGLVSASVLTGLESPVPPRFPSTVLRPGANIPRAPDVSQE